MIHTRLIKLKFMNGSQFKYNDLDIYITRSGYTGEDGFEISINNKIVESKFDLDLLNSSELCQKILKLKILV